jgi:hypothetical protein
MKTTIAIAKNKWQNPTKKEIFSVLFLVFEDNGFITHDQRPIPTLFLPPFAFSFSFASSVFVDAIYPCRSSFRTICAMLGVLFVSLLCVDSQPTLFFLFFFFFLYHILWTGVRIGKSHRKGRRLWMSIIICFFFCLDLVHDLCHCHPHIRLLRISALHLHSGIVFSKFD